MENNVFSFKRFWDFFIYDIVYNHKKLWLYLGILIIILVILALLLSSNYIFNYEYPELTSYKMGDPALSTGVNLYSTSFIILGCISASLMWSEMHNKNGRLTLLMNPSSTLEKGLVKFMIYIIFFIIAFIIAVIIAESVRYLVYHTVYPQSDVLPLYLTSRLTMEQQDYIWDIFGNKMNHPVWFFIFLFFTIQSFFVLGASIWFSRSFIKSLLVFGSLTLFFYFSTGITFELIIRGKIGSMPGLFSWLAQHKFTGFYVLAILVCIINWTLAFFRMRETEIITTKR